MLDTLKNSPYICMLKGDEISPIVKLKNIDRNEDQVY